MRAANKNFYNALWNPASHLVSWGFSIMEIFFKNGKSTLIDDKDYALYQTRKWSCCKDVRSGNYYVTTQVKVAPGKYRKMGLGEFLIGPAPEGKQLDHANRISTDNRRCNLRHCTRQQNLMNRGKRKGTAFKFKGIKWSYAGYSAQIVFNSINHYLGTFKTQDESANAYNEAAIKFFGEYAALNKTKKLPC